MLSLPLMLVARRLPLNLASVVLFGLIPMASWGQQPPAAPSAQAVPQPAQPQAIHLQDYSQPRSAFPKVFQPYKTQELAQPNLGNSPRIDALLHDGKILLSIDDAIALALENNLDLEIARFNLNIAATDLLRAKSGANILGVNTGIVQNTPGGGVGGLGGAVGSGTGGTTIAAGGAGTGTNGLVGSTLGIGSPITGFDPALTGTLQLDKNNAESTSALSPVPILSQNTYTANFAYTQGFQWGTALSVGFNNSHLTTNNPTSLLSPSLGSNFQLRVTQNLLQGFGSLPNTRFIRIAKNNREISDVAFRLQVLTTVDQIENMYWDLVFAYENVRVQAESLTYAQKALEDSKRQAQVGTAPPIQVVSSQSIVATNQQNLIVAQNNLQLQQLLMKNAISRSIDDPLLAEADVVPTSTMQIPEQEPVIPIQDLINDALQHRAELAESRIDLNSRNISDKAVRNALLPTLDAYALLRRLGRWGRYRTPPLHRNRARYLLHIGPTAISEHKFRQLRRHAESTREWHSSRQRYRARAHHSTTQPGGPGKPGTFATGISPGPGAAAPVGKSNSHRSSQRAIRCAAESGSRAGGAIRRRPGAPNAGCRSAETESRPHHTNCNPAGCRHAYHRRVESRLGKGSVREISDRTRSRHWIAARSRQHRRRRCNPRTGHAPAYCSVRCASPGDAADRTTVVRAGSFGAARRTNVESMGSWAGGVDCCKQKTYLVCTYILVPGMFP